MQGALLKKSNAELQNLIVRAIAQAQLQGRAVLLSYSLDWQRLDGLQFLGASLNDHPSLASWFYWEQQSLVLAGIGVAVSTTETENGNGDRFEQAKAFIQAYLATALVGGKTSIGKILPHALGGFAFHAQADRNADSWWEFPAFRLFVPDYLLRQTLCHCTLSLNYLVQPHASVQAVTTDLEQRLTRLQKQPTAKFSGEFTAELKPRTSSQIPNCEYLEISGDRSWSEIVKGAMQLIEQQQLEKIVLARALEVKSQQPFSTIKILQSLRQDYPECVSFGINLGGASTFVGATPEFLLQFQPQRDTILLKSDVVAGSIQRGASQLEDVKLGEQLQSSHKNLQEHQIVVRSISDRLQQIGVSLAKIPPPQLLQLKNVQHLYTIIAGKIGRNSQFQAIDILAKLHPTAAMGGEPRDKALQLMQTWEQSDRGWYAAPIGWLNCGLDDHGIYGETGAFAVGIRSGYIQGDRARIFAGAGIVADSELDAELRETTLKFEALLQALSVM